MERQEQQVQGLAQLSVELADIHMTVQPGWHSREHSV
jgi:hypothetical protein